MTPAGISPRWDAVRASMRRPEIALILEHCQGTMIEALLEAAAKREQSLRAPLGEST